MQSPTVATHAPARRRMKKVSVTIPSSVGIQSQLPEFPACSNEEKQHLRSARHDAYIRYQHHAQQVRSLVQEPKTIGQGFSNNCTVVEEQEAEQEAEVLLKRVLDQERRALEQEQHALERLKASVANTTQIFQQLHTCASVEAFEHVDLGASDITGVSTATSLPTRSRIVLDVHPL